MTGKGRNKAQERNAKDAKERLLQAAVRVFAMHGFEGASTRMLAKEAGVNISAILYYFGGKDGLYEAVMRHIVSMVREVQGGRAAAIHAAFDGKVPSQTEAKALLHDFIGGFTGFLLGEKASPYMAQLIIREQMQPSPVFDILYKDVMQPMHMIFTKLVAHLTGVLADSEQAVLCAHAIFGQVLIFKTHREFVLRRTGWKTYGPREAEAIIAMILQNSDAIIAAHKRKGLS